MGALVAVALCLSAVLGEVARRTSASAALRHKGRARDLYRQTCERQRRTPGGRQMRRRSRGKCQLRSQLLV